ncbi:7382_t:CDS:2 [Paraglomus occultum]|uniref:7382_t:CDS:1 n=1 Tax=Paraglomus occultum TaxID=144539 RepID=A0A9N9DSA4_9GLOM|nr:7382_t:CDS:2 [Paraglomus occultum]
MADLNSKLRILDNLLQNYYSGISPRVTPSEYSHYRALAFETYFGVQHSYQVTEKKRGFWSRLYNKACQVGNYALKRLIGPILTSLTTGFLAAHGVPLIGYYR